ncbi:MAG: hypothetical protein HY925_12940 [Elusimicrobia bacterium]|nr:hypothetical protein [Elusimicrobiota bacterium]
MKGFEESETTDGRERVCRLVLKDGKPDSLVFFAYEEDIKSLTTRMSIYRSTLAGKLQSAVFTTGKIDEHGEAVRGSAQDTPLNILSETTQFDFSRELDFWLKGKLLIRKGKNSAQPLAGSK